MAVNGGFRMTPITPIFPSLGAECIAISVLFNVSFPIVYLISKRIYERRNQRGQ